MARAALALCVLILLAGCENAPHPVPPEPGSSGPIPGVIPWTPLTPNLTPPSPPQGPVPIPPGTPPCQAPDLAGVVIAKNGAGGHIFVSFRFAGVSRGACYLDGTPAIGLIDADGHAIAFRQLPPFGATPQPGPALIEPGPAPESGLGLKVGQADLTIDWVTQPEACPAGFQAVLPAKAMIAIPAGGILTISMPPEPPAYLCSGLGVGAFEGPYVPIQPSAPPPLPAISMQVPSAGRVGVALPYLVTLSNDHPQTIDLIALCPTYEEELFADLQKGSPPLGGKHIYALNCGPAGSIAAGASITFQMVFLVPVDAAPGKYTLFFGLGYWNAMTSFSQATVTLR